MALAKFILLQALLFSLLLLMVPSQSRMYPTSTRPTISQATSTICGITAGLLHHRIQCTKYSELADLWAVVPSLPKVVQGSGVISKKSNTGTAEPCEFPSEIIEQSRALSQAVWELTLHNGWIAYAVLGIVFGKLFCLVCLIGFGLTVRAKEDAVAHDEENQLVPSNAAGPTFPVMKNVQVFSFNELKTITKDFCNRNRIGLGGYGIVFRGQISHNLQVAVKRIDTRSSSNWEKAFKTELETLSKARHSNVVDLIGYNTENNERLLVYKFMTQKDLSGHLHHDIIWQPKSKLFSSWKLRVKVLLDAARGIEYLHKNEKQRMIHRDIKSANILIDKNWDAKISDFGFAVFGPEKGCDYVKIEKNSGTPGYLDPECNSKNLRATPRNDVYSFGVVMLEVVTGLKPVGVNIKLANSAALLIRSGNLDTLLDKRLAMTGRELKAVTRVAHLAAECVKLPGVGRPDMTAVVTELYGVLALLGRHKGKHRVIHERDSTS